MVTESLAASLEEWSLPCAKLRLVDGHARLLKIGTGILHVPIKKRAEQCLRQIIMMGNVALGCLS